LRDSKGWDGKLRMPPTATAQVANPEALSDPEYSDEENVLPGEKIEADEGGCYISREPVVRRLGAHSLTR
jgi:protein phosphatase 1 regulatory subunit 7